MITITRRLEFDYGHRVLGHEGKCRHLHGHRGVVEITVQAPELDSIGRVVDFGVIKRLVGGWIDNNWDHNFLMHPDDPLNKIIRDAQDKDDPFQGREPYVMREGNPTAENMAKELFYVAQVLLTFDLEVIKIRIWETPSCYADYSLGNHPCSA